MTPFQTILQDIGKQKYAPVYLLDGEEPYYIDRLVEALEQIIPEEEKDFNLITLYGGLTDVQEVIGAARQFPMFGKRILIILKEAHQMKDLADLGNYIASPQPSTVLVIEYRFKKIDRRSKLDKLVSKHGVYFSSNKIKEYQIPEWIIGFCKSRNSQIGMNEAQMLAAYLGEDLQKITNELDKIWINKDEGKDITVEKIEKYIGINREYNMLDLPMVVFENNYGRLANMLNYFSANPNAAPMPALIGIFCGFLQRVYMAQQTPKSTDRQLGIWAQHRKVAVHYSPAQIHQSIVLLEEYAHKAVGIEANNKDSLLKEMVGKMQVVCRR